MWIDAHAHIAEVGTEVGAQLESLKNQGLVASIQGGIGPEDWQRQLALAARDPAFFKPVLGLHPWWVIEHSRNECDAALKRLEPLLGSAVALGELGLDFFRDQAQDSRALQQRVFEQQLELAARFRLPLVLHVVHAHEGALTVLRTQKAPLRGIVHAFSGSYEVARQYLDLGLKLSVGPGLAQPGRFKQLKAALPRLAPTDWVLESDGQGPELFVAARAAAGLTGRAVEEVLETSARTLRSLFF